MRRGGEKAIVRGMPAVHVRMPHAAEDREIVAVFLQQFEVGRQRVIASALFREEMLRQQTEIVADAKQAARLPARRRVSGEAFRYSGERGRHRVEHWQRKENTRAAQKLAPRNSLAG